MDLGVYQSLHLYKKKYFISSDKNNKESLDDNPAKESCTAERKSESQNPGNRKFSETAANNAVELLPSSSVSTLSESPVCPNMSVVCANTEEIFYNWAVIDLSVNFSFVKISWLKGTIRKDVLIVISKESISTAGAMTVKLACSESLENPVTLFCLSANLKSENYANKVVIIGKTVDDLKYAYNYSPEPSSPSNNVRYFAKKYIDIYKHQTGKKKITNEKSDDKLMDLKSPTTSARAHDCKTQREFIEVSVVSSLEDLSKSLENYSKVVHCKLSSSDIATSEFTAEMTQLVEQLIEGDSLLEESDGGTAVIITKQSQKWKGKLASNLLGPCHTLGFHAAV